MEKTQTEIAKLVTNKPRLIQRCFIHKNGALKYEYMRSTEYQSDKHLKALKSMFEKEFTSSTMTINVFGRNIDVLIIASGMFDFVSYFEVIKGLFVRRSLGINDEWGFNIDTEVWFDFINGVFFVFKQSVMNDLVFYFLNVQDEFVKKVV